MIKNLRPNLLLLAMVVVYASCRKETPQPKTIGNKYPTISAYKINLPDSADNYQSVTATLNIDKTTTSPIVPDDFLGFSFEKQIVTDPTYLSASNTSFINLFKNLDGGMIRIGGATVDRTFYSPKQRNTLADDTLFNDDVDRYKAFAQAVGWKTIWGLNLGTGTPENDGDEAKYVTTAMGSQIASFAIGNEPAYLYVSGLRQYSYSENDYLNEFNSFAAGIRKSVPNIMFSGPENETSPWGIDFMTKLSGQVNMLSVHYYRMGPAGSPNVTMDQLIHFDPRLEGMVLDIQPTINAMKLPYRVTECNSVYGGGQHNMSDAYSASLWGTEFMFYLAQQGVEGVNFHTGGTPAYVYSAISTVNGKNVAKPLYYAMLLFHQANIRQFTKNELTNSSNLNIDTYTFTTKGNKKGIMVINKDLTTDLSITINANSMLQTATVYQLIGPALTSLTGTNINGATVNDDGTFAVEGQDFTLANKYASVVAKVKPTSAMLIMLD